MSSKGAFIVLEGIDGTGKSTLSKKLKAFLEENDEAIFLISGLEYLVSQTNFVKILKFVQLLTEAAAVHNSIFLLPMSPGALAPREVKLLEREFQDIRHQCHDGRDQEVMEQEE